MIKYWRIVLAGIAAGTVNGLFGAGGGMVLIPLLRYQKDIGSDQIFPASVRIILPICCISLWIHTYGQPLPFPTAWPYLAGGILGGLLAARWGRLIPTKWLHRFLGIMILWGGIRYLC